MDNQTLKPLAEEITDRLFETYNGTLKGDRLVVMQKTENKGTERDLGGRNVALPRSSDTEPPKLSERLHADIAGSRDEHLQDWYDKHPNAQSVEVSFLPCENNMTTQSDWMIAVTYRLATDRAVAVTEREGT